MKHMQSLDRRSVITISGAAFTTVFAGCQGEARDNIEQKTDTIKSITTNQDTSTGKGAHGGQLYLQITGKVKGGVEARMTLEEVSSSSVVYDQTNKFEYRETVHLGDEFEQGKEYRFRLSINGETLFNRTTSWDEYYTLEITSPSKVVVTDHEHKGSDDQNGTNNTPTDSNESAPGAPLFPDRLGITNKVRERVTLTVKLINNQNSTVVYNNSHTFASYGRTAEGVYLGNEFKEGRDYRVQLFIGGEMLFNRVIKSYEAYFLEIESRSKVVVDERVVATESD